MLIRNVSLFSIDMQPRRMEFWLTIKKSVPICGPVNQLIVLQVVMMPDLIVFSVDFLIPFLQYKQNSNLQGFLIPR